MLLQNGAQITTGCPGFVVVLIVHGVSQLVVLRVLSQQFRQDNVPLVPERLAAVSQIGLRGFTLSCEGHGGETFLLSFFTSRMRDVSHSYASTGFGLTGLLMLRGRKRVRNYL